MKPACPTVLFERMVMGAEKTEGMGSRKFPRLVMKNQLLQSAPDMNYTSIQLKQGYICITKSFLQKQKHNKTNNNNNKNPKNLWIESSLPEFYQVIRFYIQTSSFTNYSVLEYLPATSVEL